MERLGRVKDPVRRRLRRRAAGNPASAVYGTIVAAAVVAAEGGTGHSTASIVSAMFGTLVVFWFAHGYTEVLATRITGPGSTVADARQILRHELPVVESGIPLAAALVVTALVGGSTGAGVIAALVVGVAELLGWAVLAARRTELPRRQAVPYVLVAGLLGVAVIGLKLAIH